MTQTTTTIVGDDIENPGNVTSLLIVSSMFEAACVFREHVHLARPEVAVVLNEHQARILTVDEISTGFRPLITLDNVPGAAEIYGYRPPAGDAPALVVGNERRGVSHDLLALSDSTVQIPMISQSLNCLNVASAAAVGLYYLTRNGGGRARVAAHPERHRPELLLLAPTDHVELGSSIRSAGAFGWRQLLVEDRHAVWFGIQRAVQAEGRAAARRARNPIRIVPALAKDQYAFDDVCVVTPEPGGIPLSRAELAGGSRQLLVIPEIRGVDFGTIDWERYGKNVRFVTLETPCRPPVRRFRLDASIILAETTRQVGRPPAYSPRKRVPTGRRYDRTLRTFMPDLGEVVYLEELERY